MALVYNGTTVYIVANDDNTFYIRASSGGPTQSAAFKRKRTTAQPADAAAETTADAPQKIATHTPFLHKATLLENVQDAATVLVRERAAGRTALIIEVGNRHNEFSNAYAKWTATTKRYGASSPERLHAEQIAEHFMRQLVKKLAKPSYPLDDRTLLSCMPEKPVGKQLDLI